MMPPMRSSVMNTYQSEMGDGDPLRFRALVITPFVEGRVVVVFFEPCYLPVCYELIAAVEDLKAIAGVQMEKERVP